MRLLLLSFLFLGSAAFACDCPPIQKIDKKGSEQYDVIFRGTVDSVSGCKGKATVYFHILDLFKGVVTERFKFQYECESSCQMSFEKGEEWIIYSVAAPEGKLEIELCSHSRKLMAGDDYYAVTSGQSYSDELASLKKFLGNKRIREEGDETNQGQYDHQNIQPSGYTKLWLLGISLVVFMLFYYLFHKYFR